MDPIEGIVFHGRREHTLRAFHTTEESRRESQPHVSRSGAVIIWDGRLDKRAELISRLRDDVTACSTDVEIVAAAYEKWGANLLR